MPLGKASEYPAHYAPDQLYAVPRLENRQRLGLTDGRWPWHGEDLWQAYEVSWLSEQGVPRVAVATLRVPAASPNLVESKSLKLYLNSLNQTCLADAGAVAQLIEKDLSSLVKSPVQVQLYGLHEAPGISAPGDGVVLIDDEPVQIDQYAYDPALLRVERGLAPVSESLCSHLLKSNCPVTGQPDWASLFIDYQGPKINRAQLLKYIVGFRQCQDFHEHCVETIFTDVMRYCQPAWLTVSARYTRRGGIEINPWRSTHPGSAPILRLSRQ